MQSSLRILQVTLIITQITKVIMKGSSSPTAVGVVTTSVKTEQTATASQLQSSVTTSPLQAAKTSSAYSSSTQKVPPTTSVLVSQNASPSPTKMSDIVYSSSPMQTGSPTTTIIIIISVPVTSPTEQLRISTDVSNSSKVTIGVSSSTPSKTALSLTSLEGSVSEKVTEAGSQTIVPSITSTEQTKTTNNAVSLTSTKATTLSPSGLLTSQTQSITTKYYLSSASQRDSNSAEPKPTLTTSLPVSVNWTDWSVDSSHCQEYCSEKGGTVTASRQCYTHLKTLEEKVCTRHDNSTKVVKCRDHCPVSGKETFGSSISTLAVSILLVMLSSTFVRD